MMKSSPSPRIILIGLAAAGLAVFMTLRWQGGDGHAGGDGISNPGGTLPDKAVPSAKPGEWVRRLHGLALTGEKTASRETSMELAIQMTRFDAAQLQEALALLLADSEVEANLRYFMAQLLLSSLAQLDPDTAVATFDRLRSSMGGSTNEVYLLEGILDILGRSQPGKAVEVINGHSDVWPDAKSRELSVQTLLWCTGARDPGIALGLMRKIDGIDPVRAARMAFAIKPVELKLVREFVERQPGAVGEGIQRGAFGLYGETLASSRSFQEATQEIDAAGLNSAELLAVARAIAGQDREHDLTAAHLMDGTVVPVDVSSWLGWLETRLPAAEYPQGAARLLDQWARTDADAAESWLAAEPENPAKIAGTTAFVEALAVTDPDRATRAAMTLPENEREHVLLTIENARK